MSEEQKPAIKQFVSAAMYEMEEIKAELLEIADLAFLLGQEWERGEPIVMARVYDQVYSLLAKIGFTIETKKQKTGVSVVEEGETR